MIKKIMNFFYKSLILTKNNEDNNCYLKNFLFEITQILVQTRKEELFRNFSIRKYILYSFVNILIFFF
jgi:hypothetical protein